MKTDATNPRQEGSPNSHDPEGVRPTKSRFNLSEWALEHKSLVWYFMIISAVAGIFAYINLGREEDPSFTIKTMVIAAHGPVPRLTTRPGKSPIGSKRSSKSSTRLTTPAVKPRRARP
jgi:hypothetical protein